MSSVKSSLKDDQEFNIWFVKEIEKQTSLYSHNDPYYINKQRQEEIWQNIATAAGGSVMECKERWKNLRACFTRHLKHRLIEMQTGAKLKKPYYLAEHMNFILPFTKLRSHPPEHMKYFEDKIKAPDTAVIYLDTEDEGDEESRYEYEHETNYSKNSYDTLGGHSLSDELNSEVKLNIEEYDNSVRNPAIKRPYEEDDDADLLFLKSLLPDMKEMSNSQKRKFKIQILNLIDQILEPPAENMRELNQQSLM